MIAAMNEIGRRELIGRCAEDRESEREERGEERDGEEGEIESEKACVWPCGSYEG